MTIRAPFKPHFGSTQTVTPAVGAATVSISPDDKTVRVRNTGANIGFFRTFRFADGALNATAADMPVAPNETVIIEKQQDHDRLSHISATGTTFVITTGEGGS